MQAISPLPSPRLRIEHDSLTIKQDIITLMTQESVQKREVLSKVLQLMFSSVSIPIPHELSSKYELDLNLVPKNILIKCRKILMNENRYNFSTRGVSTTNSYLLHSSSASNRMNTRRGGMVSFPVYKNLIKEQLTQQQLEDEEEQRMFTEKKRNDRKRKRESISKKNKNTSKKRLVAKPVLPKSQKKKKTSKTYCKCKTDTGLMIECSSTHENKKLLCNGWIHPECFQLDTKKIKKKKKFICPLCSAEKLKQIKKPQVKLKIPVVHYCEFCGNPGTTILGQLVKKHKKYIHEFCFYSSNVKLPIAKNTSSVKSNKRCSSEICFSVKEPNVNCHILCSNKGCNNVMHFVCCKHFQSLLSKIPSVKVNNKKLNKKIDGLRKQRIIRLLQEHRESITCNKCFSRNVTRRSKRKR